MISFDNRVKIVELYLAGMRPIEISSQLDLDQYATRKAIYSFWRLGEVRRFCVPGEPIYQKILADLRKGLTHKRIGEKYGFSKSQIYYVAEKEGIKKENYYGTVEKDGIRYDITNMGDFQKEHNISYHSLKLVLDCEVKSRKGFTNPDYDYGMTARDKTPEKIMKVCLKNT